MRRSVPSRVRSPTPANTDTPPWFWATRRIISVMSTVLPTPAPPNRPILPPARYGVSRSMTLMPVSNICLRGSSSSKGGASRWMSQRSSWSKLVESVSRAWPQTLKMWPSTSSPTGMLQAVAGVAHRGAPRQAVGRAHADGPHPAATRSAAPLRPASWWSARRLSTDISMAVFSSGMASGGNSTSTTGPATATIRPSLRFAVGSVMVMMQALRGPRGSRANGDRSRGFLPADRASAPPTISMISVVIVSWRARFMTRV